MHFIESSYIKNVCGEVNAALICSHLEGIRCYYTINTDDILIIQRLWADRELEMFELNYMGTCSNIL